MFFHKSQFRHILHEDTANTVAKIANEIIDKHAIVLYGTMLQDGQATEFSSKQQHTDTHVALAVGVEPMGFLAPSDSPVLIDKVTSEDIVKAQEDKIERLEQELKLRGKDE